jgi:hypothetical protein
VPAKDTVPDVGAMSPHIVFRRVVFPAPEGPTTVTTSPSVTRNVMSFRARYAESPVP